MWRRSSHRIIMSNVWIINMKVVKMKVMKLMKRMKMMKMMEGGCDPARGGFVEAVYGIIQRL